MELSSSEMINTWHEQHPSMRRKRRSAHMKGDISRRVKRAHDIDEECNEEIFCWARNWADTTESTTMGGVEETLLGCDDASLALEEALVAVKAGQTVSEEVKAKLKLVAEKHCRQSVRNAVADVLLLLYYEQGQVVVEEAINQALLEAEEVQSCQVREAVIQASWPLENLEDISAWLNTMEEGLDFYVDICSGGEGSDAYIMGGSEAMEGDWKSAVAIYKDNRFLCGATIIGRDTIVTAAHCLAGYKEDGGAFYTVRAGMLRKQSSSPLGAA